MPSIPLNNNNNGGDSNDDDPSSGDRPGVAVQYRRCMTERAHASARLEAAT